MLLHGAVSQALGASVFYSSLAYAASRKWKFLWRNEFTQETLSSLSAHLQLIQTCSAPHPSSPWPQQGHLRSSLVKTCLFPSMVSWVHQPQIILQSLLLQGRFQEQVETLTELIALIVLFYHSRVSICLPGQSLNSWTETIPLPTPPPAGTTPGLNPLSCFLPLLASMVRPFHLDDGINSRNSAEVLCL